MSADRIRGHAGAQGASLVWPIAASALLGLAMPGCGVNISPQSSGQTDANAPPPTAAPAAVAMTPAPSAGAPAMPMMTPGASSGGAPYGGGAGFDANAAQQASANYGGGPPPGAAATVDAAQMEAAMRAQQQAGAAEAAAGEEQMRKQAEAAMRAQQNFGGNAAGAPSPDEMARRQRENAPGAGAEGNALGGAFPGGGGQYGGRGGEGGGGTFKEDDAEYVVIKFADAVQADDYESAGKLVADKATGLLASVRKGDTSDNQKQQLKAYVTGLKHIGTRSAGRSKTANFNGGSNKVLSFKIEKISDEFVISDLDIHDAPRQRARR